jgi:predicted transcriptional regulator
MYAFVRRYYKRYMYMLDPMQSSKTINIIKKKKLEPDFEPSMKTLSRIFKTMEDNGPEAKTSLSLDTNLNYARLAKHIVWLEKKGLVESTIDKSKINVGLTAKGRVFASTISSDGLVSKTDTNVSAS